MSDGWFCWLAYLAVDLFMYVFIYLCMYFSTLQLEFWFSGSYSVEDFCSCFSPFLCVPPSCPLLLCLFLLYVALQLIPCSSLGLKSRTD